MIYLKDIRQITPDEIRSLIANGTIENKHLEFKETIPDNSQTDRNKFLATVVSFANSDGGLIIYGLRQNRLGAADEVKGVSSASTDQDFTRLQQIIQAGIEPRINVPDICELVVDGKKLYLMRVDQGLNRPHRASHNQKFYGRSTSGRYELDISELRNLFLFSRNTKERVERFVVDRIIRIKSGDFPFGFLRNRIVALHLVPLIALEENFALDLRKTDKEMGSISPIETRSYNHVYNFDGRMNYFITPEKKWHHMCRSTALR